MKREWKVNKDGEDVKTIKKKFFKVTKILNIIRKQESRISAAEVFQKNTKTFRDNPYKFAQNLYKEKVTAEPQFDSKAAYKYFAELYSDQHRGMTYPVPPNLLRPPAPTTAFLMDPPSTKEVKNALQRKRNSASPGPNGIPYLIYKKCPLLLRLLTEIFQEMWPSFKCPLSKYGIARLIHKGGLLNEASNFRPVTMTNTDGKILLSIIASRALNYMKCNNYHDLSILKGFIENMAGCVEHTTMLAELLRNAKSSSQQITVCWTDLANACGSLRHDLIQLALSWYGFPDEIQHFVLEYYEGISIVIKGGNWSSQPVALMMGIFQGCPLSVQLFNPSPPK